MKSTLLRHIAPILFLIATTAILAGCSTQRNTAQSRWWHAFNARYNTYYNGTVAYIDASLEKEQGNRDNYLETLPLYTVGNKASKELGKANYERAIEKCEKAIHQHSIKKRPEWTKDRRKTAKDIEWLSRREYNPFLWKAWMLMGRSQFFKGDFEEAATTFSYMSRLYATQPAIYGKARAWLAKCYIEEGWIYDAEDVIKNMERDSIHWSAQKEWDYTYADYYIHTGNFRQAITYLHKVIRHEMRRRQKTRLWFLLGQLEAALGNNQNAYKAFKHVVRLNPPYELELNARIAMSEVMAKNQAKQMVGKLKRMARSDKNKDYLDQIYYAIGNIYLAQKDTLQAIRSYEKGNISATQSRPEKGILLLHLGNLYWETEQFKDAHQCYNDALGMIDKEHKDYQELDGRSKVLDELVPYIETIQLQDSLQTLAQMDEKDRNAAIDRVIEALKKKEKEERDRQAENIESSNVPAGNTGFSNLPASKADDTANGSTWYFYNPMAVGQGKTAFQRQWGKRENIDNWQRANKTVVANFEELPGDTTPTEEEAQAEDKKEEETENNTLAENDPHKREYYMAQIPFSPEQLDASNQLLKDALLQAGIVFKDKLDNLPQSEKRLRRLTDQYPGYEHQDDTYYHLYLLYARENKMEQADSYIERLKAEFPNSQWTALLADPYYKENAQFGTHIEDSLYTATYEAFKAGRYQDVTGNATISETRFPMGANRDKFLFIGGLTKLNKGKIEACLKDMRQVVEQYPDSRLSEMAGMIINGVTAGRRLYGGKFDLEDVWTRRNTVLNEEKNGKSQQLSEDRNADYVFLYVYEPDSVNENQLLFEMAKYNFTTYMVRNFDMQIEELEGLHRMFITGFRNYDEAWQYAKAVTSQPAIKSLTAACRTFIISQPNLQLIGKSVSYADYEQYYIQNFSNLKVSEEQLLNEPAEIIIQSDNTPQDADSPQTGSQLSEDEFILEEDDNAGKNAPSEDININLEDEYYELDGF